MRGRGAAAGAVALAMLLAWLLLRGEPGPTGPETIPPAAPRREAAQATSPRPATAPEPTTPAKVPAARPPEKPKAFSLDVVAANEGGFPVQGVTFLTMLRGEGGTPEVSLAPDALSLEGTNGEGKCTLRWDEAPEEILLLVIGRRDEVVGVENGVLVGPDTSGEIVFADGEAETLRLTMRPRAGIGTLFLVDGSTGEPVTNRLWLSRIRFPDGSLLPGSGGRIGEHATRVPIELPALPRRDIHAPDGRVLEFVVQGYEPAEVPLADFRGSRPLRLVPRTPSVVGVIVVPGVQGEGMAVSSSIHPTPGSPLMEPGKPAPLGWAPVAPQGIGPFAIHDLPDGTWTLRVCANTPNGSRWARRTIVKQGGTVDLGTIEVFGWAGIRARLLDREEVPVPRTFFHATDAEWGPLGFLQAAIVVEGGGDGFSIRTHGPIRIQTTWDPDGWFETGNLAPGTKYRVSTIGNPPATVEVTTPEENGAVIDVELRLPEKVPEKETADGDFHLPVEEE